MTNYGLFSKRYNLRPTPEGLITEDVPKSARVGSGDLTILQRQLGHKRLSTTTDRYVRYAVKDLQNERMRLGLD
jgi:integrase